MKRKDWISLIALLLIIAIAFLGEFISVQGNLAITMGNLWYLIPMIILLVGAVLMCQRKGNHTRLFKSLSWISFCLSLVFLFFSADSFMHFFNVQDSAKKEEMIRNTGLVIADISNMHQAYKDGVDKRRQDYQHGLRTAIETQNNSLLNEVSPLQSKWIPKDAKKFADDWADKTMLPTYKAYKGSLDSISPIIDKAIIRDFNIFTAGGEFTSLQTLYNLHKLKLSEKYSTLNKIEESEGASHELIYTNQEEMWKDSHRIFETKEFNLAGCIIFIILAFLASFTFLCIKDESIRKPKMRTNVQNVYSAGHRL